MYEKVRPGTVQLDRQALVKTLTRMRLAVFGLVLFVCAAPQTQAGQDEAPFRVFLLDGTAVSCLGEFARVGDRVIFSIPIGRGAGAQQSQVVSLPFSSVDWGKTEQYAVSVRAARYAATDGEADYAALTATVARVLNQLPGAKTTLERLQLVEQVRGVVATWPRDHYAYRAADVREIQALLDDMVSQLRADAGVTQFDLTLVANIQPPPAPDLRPPTLAESIEQVLGVARASDLAADRIALRQAALRLLDGARAALPADWAKKTREAAERSIADDVRTDRLYRDMAARTLSRARAAAADADPAAVEDLLTDALRRDERLGRKRPGEMSALVTALQSHLDAARRLRLAHDRWRSLYPVLRDYQRSVSEPVRQMNATVKSLEAIRRLTGPDPDALMSMRERLDRAGRAIARITPPADLVTTHDTLVSACQMAIRSVEMRERAIASGDMQTAWDASSAAAGAVMLLGQARQQIRAAVRPPEPR